MASLSEMLAANNAAVSAQEEFDALLAADFALLAATEALLHKVRDMKVTRILRQSVSAPIIKFAEELKPLMDKYGVELVASEMYVNAFDLRVVGTTTRAGYSVRAMTIMTDMHADPVMRPPMQDANACGQAKNTSTSFVEKCVSDPNLVPSAGAIMRAMEKQGEQACGIRPLSDIAKYCK